MNRQLLSAYVEALYMAHLKFYPADPEERATETDRLNGALDTIRSWPVKVDEARYIRRALETLRDRRVILTEYNATRATEKFQALLAA